MKKKITFLIPKNASSFTHNAIAKPMCKTAHYFCLLAGKKQLSLKEIFVIQKIGFSIDFSIENEE